MVADWVVLLGVLLLMVFGPVLFYGSRLVRALSLGSAWEELERSRVAPEWVPSELEVSTARLRALRRRRRRDELDDWDRSFHALAPCGCRSCR